MDLDKRTLLRYLKDLIKIPSYDSEKAVADYIIKELKKATLNPRRDKYGNVILSLGRGEGFLLNAHMDTVDIKGWERRALNPITKNGRIYGRGASDTKSGIATMMEIARTIQKEKLKRKIIFLFTVKEEDSTLKENGAYLACKYLKAKNGIVLEPSFRKNTLNVGVGCKGVLRFNIIVKGKSCHSGYPQRGLNPIYLANSLIGEIQKIRCPSKKYKIMSNVQKLSGTISVTQIKAMEGINIIPDKCLISIDCRLLPGKKGILLERKIRELCDKCLMGRYEIESHMIEGYFSYDKTNLNPISKIASEHGYSANFSIKEGRTDCCIFMNYGNIKTICLGSGESGQGHIIDESVSIKGFLNTSDLIYSIVKKQCVDY